MIPLSLFSSTSAIGDAKIEFPPGQLSTASILTFMGSSGPFGALPVGRLEFIYAIFASNGFPAN